MTRNSWIELIMEEIDQIENSWYEQEADISCELYNYADRFCSSEDEWN